MAADRGITAGRWRPARHLISAWILAVVTLVPLHPMAFPAAAPDQLHAGDDQTQPAEPDAEPPPIDLGLEESVGVRLILLDVEVHHRDGQPIPGLTRDDFQVFERTRAWEIYSVDDLCSCADRDRWARPGTTTPAPEISSHGSETPLTDPAAADPGTSSADAAASRLFVMYFDFSQLQSNGRRRARAEAARWIREAMGPGDRLLLAGYASQAGLRTLSRPSGDRQALLEALESTFDQPEFHDSFPDFRTGRLTLCGQDPTTCGHYAWEEHLHGRRSFRMLKLFLTSLDLLPGRKQLFFFTQNGGLHPYQLYVPGEPHLRRLAEEIGAEANAARTVIHSLHTGQPGLMSDSAEQAVSLGWHMGEYTGGSYNRAPKDLFPLLESASTRCSCTYRIALEPRRDDQSDLHEVRVEVAGRTLPHRYRVRYFTQAEQSFRKLVAHLASPGGRHAFPVQVSLRPVGLDKKRWDVAVQARFDPRCLLQVPGRTAHEARSGWDVGGLLHDTSREEAWEFYGSASARLGEERPGLEATVHEERISRVPPGEYRWVAAVRDQQAGAYSAAEASLSLPRPSEQGVLGPYCLEGVQALRLSLPWLRGRDVTPEAGRLELSVIPCTGDAIALGTPLLLQTWICHGQRGGGDGAFQGVILRDGVPVYRLWPAAVTAFGDCDQVSDAVDTARLPPGDYSYSLIQGGTARAGLDFTLRPGGRPQAAACDAGGRRGEVSAP